MPIVAADIQFRYSGGTTNTSAAACLGGAMSTDAAGVIDTGVANDLWDDVASAEASAGDTEYRGFYIKNNHATLTYSDARAYISPNTTSADDTFAIAIADEAVNNAEETIANESTAPVGPVFSSPADYATGLALNTTTGLTGTSYKGMWIRRVVTASAAALTNNSGTVAVQGDTLS